MEATCDRSCDIKFSQSNWNLYSWINFYLGGGELLKQLLESWYKVNSALASCAGYSTVIVRIAHTPLLVL